jgi:hypothetical protein
VAALAEQRGYRRVNELYLFQKGGITQLSQKRAKMHVSERFVNAAFQKRIKIKVAKTTIKSDSHRHLLIRTVLKT